MILILILIYIIYNLCGIYLLFPLIISIINIIISTFMIWNNPRDYFSIIVRYLSIIIIIIILFNMLPPFLNYVITSIY